MSDEEITESGDGSDLPEKQVDEAAEAVESSGEEGAEGENPEGDESHRDKTISKITRNWRATERDRDHWKAVAQRNNNAPAEQPATEAAVEEKLKTLEDFEFDSGKYQAYLIEHTEKRAVKAAQAELRKEQVTRHQGQVIQSHKSREAEFIKTSGVEDYQSTAYSEAITISPAMAQVIRESEDGPAVAYYLGKNPDIAQVIAQLSPLAAARELGRLEARLADKRESVPQRTISKAPPPPAKIEGSGSPGAGIKPDTADSDKLSDAEWTRRRKAQIQKRQKH